MRPRWVMSLLIAGLAGPAPSGADILTAEVTSLSDPDAVYDTLRELGATELPVEALAYYLEGVEAGEAGDTERALRFLELAVKLDPAFPEAHLALARYRLASDPKGSLEDLGQAVQASFRTFAAQHLFLANLVLTFLTLAAIGLLVLFAYLAMQHFPRLHHSVREHFGLWFDGRLAALLAVIAMLIPALWRIGIMPLALAFLGVMWPWLRRGEKRWVAGLTGLVVLAPLVLWAASPLVYGPLDPGKRSYLLGRAMGGAHSRDLVRALGRSLEEHEEDADLHFALAMVHRRGGELGRAEEHYRAALELGAPPARVQNNLGVIAFMRGDYDAAIESLQESIAHDPDRAASHFNLSQTFAKKLYFEKADQELAKANKLSFNRIRDTLRHTEGDARQTMIDEPLPVWSLWKAAWRGERHMPGLPDWMSFVFAGSLWLFVPISLVIIAFSLVLGRRLYQNLPTTGCTNCGRPICRRCVRRVRRETYCSHCGDVLLRIQSSSYSKLVLESQIRRKRRISTLIARLTDWILPGFHAGRTGHSTVSALLALTAMAAVLGFMSGNPPVPRLAWIADATPGPWWPEAPAGLLALTFLASWITVLKLRMRRVYRNLGREPGDADDETPLRGRPADAA